MPLGQAEGDSGQPLTLHAAAERAAGLISDDMTFGDTTNADAKPEKAAKPAEPEQESEPVEEEAPEADAEAEEETAPGNDEESEVEEESDAAPEQPDEHEVVFDGQKAKVTLDELKKGYSRQQDYTRKTMQHSENVKAFESEKTAVKAERAYNLEKYNQLEQQLTASIPEPDWDKIAQETPDQLAHVRAAWDIHKERLGKITAERQELEKKVNADAQEAYQAHLRSEGTKMVEAIPAWKDQAVFKKDHNDMREYARSSLGLSDAELDGVSDHRTVVALYKAMLYDRGLQQKAKAAAEAKPKIEKVRTAEPGTKPRTVNEATRRKQRLAKTNRIDDAASVLELLLPD